MNVNAVQPLREQSITGTITYLAQGYGTILQDIHFTLSACARGYRPTKGDKVTAECVEYKHHRNNWRAYKVVPILGTENEKKADSIPAKTHLIPKPVIPLLSTSGKVAVGYVVDGFMADTELSSSDPVTKNSSAVALKGSYQDKLAACRLPGQRPLRMGVPKLSTKLKGYPIPEELRECVEEEGDVMAVETTLEEVLCVYVFS